MMEPAGPAQVRRSLIPHSLVPPSGHSIPIHVVLLGKWSEGGVKGSLGEPSGQLVWTAAGWSRSQTSLFLSGLSHWAIAERKLP